MSRSQLVAISVVLVTILVLFFIERDHVRTKMRALELSLNAGDAAVTTAVTAAYKAADAVVTTAYKVADDAVTTAYKAADDAVTTAYKAADSHDVTAIEVLIGALSSRVSALEPSPWVRINS